MTIFGRLIPWWMPIAVIGFLCTLLLGQQVQVSNAKARVARAEQDLTAYKLEVSNAHRIASDVAREEGERRQSEFEAAAAAAREENAALQKDVVRLAGAADGVRDELAAFKRRAAARACPTNGGKGEPDTGAVDLLAILYQRADREAGILAENLDAVRIAGAACERSVDAMK